MSNIPPGNQGRRNFSAFFSLTCAVSLFYSFRCTVAHVQRPLNAKPNSDYADVTGASKHILHRGRDCSGSFWANYLHMWEFSSAREEKGIMHGVSEDFSFKLVTLSCSHETLPFSSHIKTADGIVKGLTSPLICTWTKGRHFPFPIFQGPQLKWPMYSGTTGLEEKK